MHSILEPISDVLAETQLQVGLLQANFTASLFRNGAASLLPVTIAAIAGKPGFYAITFTPNLEGLWSLDVIVTAKPNVRYQSAYHVRNIEEVIAEEVLQSPVPSFNVPGTVSDYLNKTKKYTSNRVLISNGLYTIKDDDGLTDFETGTITPSERTPD